jgi:RNA polymerase sigma factor (sigma-70 family)
MDAPALTDCRLPRLEPCAMPDSVMTQDQRFLRYVKTGDAQVLDDLIVEVIDSCFRQARRITGNTDMAEEAVQEAFLELVRSARKFNGSVSFAAWIGRIVCTTALRQRRRARRHSAEASTAAGEKINAADTDDGGDADLVRRALDDLPVQYRLPLMLHYLNGLSQEETAKAVGISVETLTVRLTRARERLREKMKRSGHLASAAGALSLLLALPAGGAASESLTRVVATSCLTASKAAVKTAMVGKTLWIAAGALAVLGTGAALLRQEGAPTIIERPAEEQAPNNSLPNGLVGHWTFDEGSGETALDSSGNGHHGHFVGDVAWTGGSISIHGKFGYVEIPNSVDLEDIQEGSFTLAARYKPFAVPEGSSTGNIKFNDFHAICVKQGWHAGLIYGKDQTFRMGYHLQDSSDDIPAGSTSHQAYAPGVFHHVTGVVNRTAGTTEIFVNGRSDGVKRWLPSVPARDLEAETWKFGIAESSQDLQGRQTWPVNGAIDSVQMYDRALTAKEISLLALPPRSHERQP